MTTVSDYDYFHHQRRTKPNPSFFARLRTGVFFGTPILKAPSNQALTGHISEELILSSPGLFAQPSRSCLDPVLAGQFFDRWRAFTKNHLRKSHRCFDGIAEHQKIHSFGQVRPTAVVDGWRRPLHRGPGRRRQYSPHNPAFPQQTSETGHYKKQLIPSPPRHKGIAGESASEATMK